MGPLTGGMFILILNLIRTDSADFGDLFAGFERCFGKLLGVGIAQALIIFLAALPGLIMIVAVGFATAAGVDDWERESEAFLGSFLGNPVTIAGFLAMWGLGLTAYIVLYFTVSLAADRSLDFVQTFHVAVRVSMRNFFPILALCLIGGVVIFVSLLPCGLGLIVSVPWRFAVMAHAYEQMFSPDASPNEQ
jgi:uncharacterized membrane protein